MAEAKMGTMTKVMPGSKTGKIIKGIGGFYYVSTENGDLYECRAKGIFRNRKQKPMVGDQVDIDLISQEEKTGNLVRIHPRKNQLVRPMAANVDQAMVMFSVHEPEPNFNLLNRFLLTMQRQDIPVIICFNKTDLAGESEKEQLACDFANCGCRLIFLCAENGNGIKEVKDILEGKTTIMAGPSGVGKSSTLNKVAGETQMLTGDVSRKIKRGRHTTRHSELIRLWENTYLMDTPGFSSLYLESMDKDELRFYFPEFSSYENRCRFNGCSHVHEPDCLVRQAVEDGEISRMRYEDYCRFYEELGQRKKWEV